MDRYIDQSSDCWLSLVVEVPGGDRVGPVVCHHWWSCSLPIMLSVQCPWHTRSLFTNRSLPAWWQPPWRPLLDFFRGFRQRRRVWQGKTTQLLSQTRVCWKHSTCKHSTNTITPTELTVCMFLFLRSSQRKSSALSALFSERWPATPPQRGALAPPTERNIDFELDVRVEIDSGKCMLHPSTQPPEHEDLAVRRWRDTTKFTISCWF